MPDSPPTPELLRSLGRLARGLSIVFWGLPIAVLVCVATAREDFLRPLNVAPPMMALTWLLYGLIQLGQFQKQERVWRAALDRAKILAVINIGLSPFLYWWNKMPTQAFFVSVVILHAASGLLFLSELNVVLVRLTAMLPEETLRQETKQFAMLNRILILCTFLFASIYLALNQLSQPPQFLGDILNYHQSRMILSRLLFALAIFLLLSPLAITMALIWKAKEVILDSVFGGQK